MLRRTIVAAALAASLSFAVAHAADPKPVDPKKAASEAANAIAKQHTYTDPAKATADFAVQGEYVGEAEINGSKVKLAAQISSRGGGDFIGAFYVGGLPGDGWDGTTRIETTGKSKDPEFKEVDFAPAADAKGYTVKWAGGTIVGKTDAGAPIELKKVERKSPTLGAKPPAGATILFDGTNTDAFEDGVIDARHALGLGPKGNRTKKKFQNFTLHGEFILPFKPYGRDQDRCNSGFYIQERYELQVLDSFGEKPTFNGTGSLYRQKEPDLNMCLPPLSWQTYDVEFKAPIFEAGKKVKNAVITVKLNGVTVHDRRELTAKTGAGKPEAPEPAPILLQQHSNPVFFRNLWIVEN